MPTLACFSVIFSNGGNGPVASLLKHNPYEKGLFLRRKNFYLQEQIVFCKSGLYFRRESKMEMVVFAALECIPVALKF